MEITKIGQMEFFVSKTHKKLDKLEIERLVEKVYYLRHWDKGLANKKNIIKSYIKQISDFIGDDGIRELDGYVAIKDLKGIVYIYTMASWHKAFQAGKLPRFN